MLVGCASHGNSTLKPNDTIVFLGDSITALGARPGGYVAQVSEVIATNHPGRGIEVIGSGISGNKVPDLQTRLDADVLQKHPSVVVIYIGINDVWHWEKPRVADVERVGTTREDFENGLRDLIGRIQQNGARVILCTPSVIGERTGGGNPQDPMLDEYAAISRRVARETGTQLLDLRRAFVSYLALRNRGNAPEGILTSDGVHLNEAGNRFLANQMLDALNVPHGD
jgi:lysophospholipase L1-like esterase